MNVERQTYLMPWYKKLYYKIYDGIVNWKKGLKFSWIKFSILVISILLIVLMGVLIVNGSQKFPIRPDYNKEGFIAYEDLTGSNTVFENDRYIFNLDYSSTHFTLTDKLTNAVWASKPDNKDNVDTLKVYYSKGLGIATEFGNYAYSINYENNKQYELRINEENKSVEVLYTLGGKIKIDYTDLPQLISIERYNEVVSKAQSFIDQLKLSSDSKDKANAKTAEADLKSFKANYLNEGQAYYGLKTPSTLSELVIKRIYRVFYDYAGYTTEDLDYDNLSFNSAPSKKYPKFEISILYTLSNDGLDVKIVNDSIKDYEYAPLLYVDVLPYFGSASIDDVGYSLIPDGSGVLIDFNNPRSYASSYEQRIYGYDYAISKRTMLPEANKISLGVYGMKVNDYGFINIITKGAENCALLSNISTPANQYNQTFYRFYNREKDVYKFSSIGSLSDITSWTNSYSTNDLEFTIKSLEGDGNYSKMAKEYQNYLLEIGKLSKKDSSNNVVLDLTLLGGFLEETNFLGIPYTRVKSLTNTDQVIEIVNKLKADQINNINIMYEGFSNNGIKSTYMGNLKTNSSIGSKNDLKKLNSELSKIGVDFYPSMRVASAYTNNSLRKNDLVRNMYGEVSVRYDNFEPAYIQNYIDGTPLYTINPSKYMNINKNITKYLNKLNIRNIGFIDFGNELSGSYQSKNTLFKNDTLSMYLEAIQKYDESFSKIMTTLPNDYSLKYTDLALNIPSSGTNYQIVETSVPFYQLVISGCIDFSSEAFNLNDEYSFDYYKMKAIETGSNIAMVWTYTNTIDLIGTEYDSFYSTYYKNWYSETINLVQEMNALGVYQSSLVSHELLLNTGKVSKSTFENGMEIVFNYSNSKYTYNSVVIDANSYLVVKEAEN